MAIWKEDIVQLNKFSRSGKKLVEVRGIVEHWTANPGASDEGHAAYFDGSDGGGERYASAHIFIDKDSATLIVPLDEVAYHANDRACKIDKLKESTSYYKNGNANLTTIGVELCVEKDGTIHPDTIARGVKVNVELCKMFKLDPLKDIYRHFDVTGKLCPRPWVEKPEIFTDFKKDVKVLLTPKVAPKPKAPKYPGHLIVKWSDDTKSVKLIQEKLGIYVDGKFGNGTYMAVRNFQAKHSLTVDGIVGKKTWSKLFG